MPRINYRNFLPIDLLLLSTLTVVCWISTNSIRYWTSTLSRSIEFYQLALMLINDRMKYLLYRRARRNMQIDSSEEQTIEQDLLFFPRPDFSNEVNAHDDILRSQSAC